MFCKNCGNELNVNEKYCNKCGCEIDNIAEKTTAVTIADISDTAVTDSNIDLHVKNQKKNKIIGIAISLLIMLIIGIVLGVHFNSDSYKINKAVQFVQKEQYSDAVNKLGKVYDPQAEIVRSYIDVLRAKDEFINSFDANVLMNAEHRDIVDKANIFKSKLYEFNENESVYLLPEELRKQFDYYIKFCQQIDSVYSDEYQETLYSKYYQPQNVFLNYTTRHRSDEFTLSDMQYNIDISKSGIEVLKNWLNNDIEDFSSAEAKFQGFSDNNFPQEFECFYNSTINLISSCESEIESEQEYIDESLKKFESDDKLYLTDPDKTATSYVIGDLEEIADMSNVGNNATIFQNTYYVDMMAYCLNNE